MEEAYRLLEDQESNLDLERVSECFKAFGFGQMDQKEKNLLKGILDINQDGVINIQDMKEIF